MYIQSFHIDNFGVFSQVQVEALSTGLTVFLGKNEAGKSTCLDFLRTMLTGYTPLQASLIQASSLQGKPAQPRVRGLASTGFSDVASVLGQQRDYIMDYAGPAGGSITVFDEDAGLVQVLRRPDSLLLTDGAGQMLEESAWDRLLCGVSSHVYRTVFGFSLSELQVFESLSDEDVRHALFGATFGMGLRSPGKVLQELEQKMQGLFQAESNAPFINELLRKLERVQNDMGTVKEAYVSYDRLCQDCAEIESELQNLQQQKWQLEQERRQAEKHMGVWQQWEEWRMLESQLARLAPVPEGFPEDGAGRLERGQFLRQEAARRVHAEQERYDNLEEKWATYTVDERVLNQRNLLQSLHEHKNVFRKAQEGLMPHMAHILRTQSLLQQHLEDLGPQWTCARIHTIDRSLQARSHLERKAMQIQNAEQAQASAALQWEKSTHAVQHAQQHLALAQKALEHLPKAEAPVEKAAREDIARYKLALENAVHGEAEKEAQVNNGQQIFQRTLHPLSLRYMEGEDALPLQDIVPHLETLKAIQEEALALAGTAQDLRQQTIVAEQSVLQAQEKEDFSRARLERLQLHVQGNADTSREKVDVRAKALRTLRHLHTTLSLEKERLAQMKQELVSRIPPQVAKNTFFMVLGGVLCACGLVGLALPFFLGPEQLLGQLLGPLPEQWFGQWQSMQFLSPWVTGAVLLVGAVFLAGGLPRTGAEHKRFAEETQERQRRIAAVEQELQHMEQQIQEQCLVGEVNDADPITLDAVEILLERQRESCVAQERILLDLEQLQAEHQELADMVRQKRQDVTSAQQQEQQALLRWHACLRAHRVHTIPSPEAASTFFARVEAALVAQTAMQQAQEELDRLRQNQGDSKQKLCAFTSIQDVLRAMRQRNEPDLEEDGTHTALQYLTFDEDAHGSHELHEQETQEEQGQAHHDASTQDAASTQGLASLLPIHTAFNAVDYSNEAVLEAAQVVLDACREADEALHQRTHADASLRHTENALELAVHEQKQSEEHCQQMQQQCQQAQEALASTLADMGLDSTLSPSMLRSVLECMDKCLSLEAEIGRLQEEKERMEKECAYLVRPLHALLEELQMPLPEVAPSTMVGENYVPFQEDWLQALDSMLGHLYSNQESQTAKSQLQEQLDVQEEALQEAHTALSDAESTMMHLLALGQTENMEEFFRLAHVREQRQLLEKRQGQVEDALRLAAGDAPLEAFLQSMANKDQGHYENFLRTTEKELRMLQQQEQDKMQTLAHTKAALEELRQSTTLSHLRQEEKNLQASLEVAAHTWSQYAVAKQLLLQAKQRFEQDRQPQVIRLASDIFSAITQEKWQGLTASLEENQLHVLSPSGQMLTPQNLSRGTQEQLYLALRLAYIRNHATEAKALPVIMDDVLVNFDPERAERTAKALLDLSLSGKKHQILFFTCHPHMADMLQKNAQESKRFIVENQNIQEA